MSVGGRFSDFAVGDAVWFERVFDFDEHGARFSELSGDMSPLHNDPKYAQSTPFGQLILPVHLAAAPLSAIAGMAFPGESSLCLEHTVRAVRPLYFGENLIYSARIVGITPARRVLRLRVCVFSGVDLALEADMMVQARYDEWPTSPAWPVWKAGQRRTCLITGAGGDIGLAAAKLAAARGWNLLLQDSSGDDGRIAAECAPAEGRIEFVKADLADEEGIREVSAAVRNTGVDAVVHCPGPRGDAPIRILASLNYSALRELRDAALPSMLRKQDGRFVFASPAPGCAPTSDDYAAARAMAESVLTGIRTRYGRFGIATASLAPACLGSTPSKADRGAGSRKPLPEQVAADVLTILETPVDTDAAEAPSRSCWNRTPAEKKSRAAVPNAILPQPSDEIGQWGARIDAAIRRTLDLAPEADLVRAGLGLTPGWDSLRHIQLVIALEEELGVSFASQEIEHLMTYQDLRRTCERKLNGKAAR